MRVYISAWDHLERDIVTVCSIMSLPCSYYPDYFSITDILATEERITSRVEVAVPRLGILDHSSESEDLKVGTKLELPFWLAFSLSARKRPIVSVELPKVYKEGYRDILEADASVVALSKWNPYYYELGMYLRQFNNRESEKITDSLLQTFKTRFRLIMDWADNPVVDLNVGSHLPVLEKGLFLAGRKARVLLIQWLEKGGDNIETSELVANLLKKREGV